MRPVKSELGQHEDQREAPPKAGALKNPFPLRQRKADKMRNHQRRQRAGNGRSDHAPKGDVPGLAVINTTMATSNYLCQQDEQRGSVDILRKWHDSLPKLDCALDMISHPI